MEKINVRSPYYIKATATGLAECVCRLWIYTGEFTTDKPTDFTYSLTKYTLNSNNYVVFEVAELIRDYIEIEFDGEYDSQCVWVEAQVINLDSSGIIIGSPLEYDYVAMYGYGYFHEGKNPELSRGLLMSNRSIFRLNDSNVRIPVFTEDTNSVAFYYQGTLKRTLIISDSGLLRHSEAQKNLVRAKV